MTDPKHLESSTIVENLDGNGWKEFAEKTRLERAVISAAEMWAGKYRDGRKYRAGGTVITDDDLYLRVRELQKAREAK